MKMRAIWLRFKLPILLGGGVFALGVSGFDASVLRHGFLHGIGTLFLFLALRGKVVVVTPERAALILALSISVAWNFATEIAQGAQHGWNPENFFNVLELLIGLLATAAIGWGFWNATGTKK